VYCQCLGDRLFCTTCEPLDAGAGQDGRDYPNCPGNASVSGRRCDDRGAVCDFPGDAGLRLCVCADLGRDRLWVCQ
jgi:hypothetical protein